VHCARVSRESLESRAGRARVSRGGGGARGQRGGGREESGEPRGAEVCGVCGRETESARAARARGDA